MKNKSDSIVLGKELEEAKQKVILYEEILNRLDVGIHVVDRKGNTIVYNDVMGQLEGENPANLLGKSLLEGMPSLTSEDSTLLRVIHTGQALNDRQQTYTGAHGKQVVTVNSTTPIYFEGKLFGALEIAKDITFIQSLYEKILDLQKNSRNRGRNGEDKLNSWYTFSDILGQSELIKAPIAYAKRAARTSSNVLIYGETGTGKELFAQSIHSFSPRSNNPFIAINCAALPEQLLESLLFGTTKGSFTGAVDRPGLFEQANGGTLMFDELNSMEMALQAKLLRVIQEKVVRRVGAAIERQIDVRIMATMNIDPAIAITQKCLREDLYYRLGVVTLRIPSLREHPEDIPLYVDSFIRKYNQQQGLAIQGVIPELMNAFMEYNWPGNVRELQHVIEGAFSLITDEEYIESQHLPMLIRTSMPYIRKEQPNSAVKEETEDTQRLLGRRESLEKEMLVNALAEFKGNITRAAKSLGVTRQVLQYKIKKYKLKSHPPV